MQAKSIHYVNPSNQRRYQLALCRDLLGDWVVVKYFGQQRQIIAHAQHADAQRYFEAQDARRCQRGYQRAG